MGSSHRSSDGTSNPGRPRRSCGCQSCRHNFGAPLPHTYDRDTREALGAAAEDWLRSIALKRPPTDAEQALAAHCYNVARGLPA